MPEDITDKTERDAANAAAIAKVAAQNLDGPGAGQPGIADTINALDTLAAGIVQKKESDDANTNEEGDKVADKSASDAAKAASDKVEADKVAAKAEADKTADKTVAAPAPTAEQAAASEAAAATKKVSDDFFKDSPTLPPKASPKSSEAFEAVKVRAAQEISKLQTALETHTKELAALKAASKESLTPEIKAEIDSLREFKAKLDIETDPKFSKFDGDIKAGDAFIYAQLRKSPLFTPEVQAEIEKFGGPSKVKMDAILTGIGDPLITRLVEGKLAELEVKQYEKQQAIEAAKSNVKSYLAERTKEWEASTTSHNQSTKAELDGLLTRVPWIQPKSVAATATEAEKKEAAEHNEFVAKTKKELDVAMNDDSPGMRATLLVGMANLFRTQARNATLIAERDAIKAELDAANASLTKLKSASTSRLRDGGGLSGDAPKPVKQSESAQFSERAGDALDRIRLAKAAAQKE